MNVFLEEADVYIGRLSKADCPPRVVGPVQSDKKDRLPLSKRESSGRQPVDFISNIVSPGPKAGCFPAPPGTPALRLAPRILDPLASIIRRAKSL